MEFLGRLANEIRRYSFEVGVTYCVNVTHVNNPHSFYVRPLEYTRYMATVQARGDPVNRFELYVGAIIIFECSLTGDYVRGRIMLVEGENDQLTCNLFALDAGFHEDRVPMQKIWKPYNQGNLTGLAFHCRLANCAQRTETWTESTIQATKRYIQGKVAQIKVVSILPDMLEVDVCISAVDDLATVLALTRHTISNFSHDIENLQSVLENNSDPVYLERILQVKSILFVRMQSGAFLDKFFAAPIDEYNAFVEDRNIYTTEALKQRPLLFSQLKKDKPVGVFYHITNKYERGIVREIFAKKYTAKVELIDWGKFIEEPLKSLRLISDIYLKNPPMAIYCTIHVSQYAKTSAFEMAKLANISRPGIEFCIQIEEISQVYEKPNQVSVFDVKM